MSERSLHLAQRIGLWLLLISAAASSAGCNRGWYRRQADAEAYALVREKGVHPHWAMDDFSIAVDPRSRMHYQYNPDCPPMPEDDPYSHELMHCVDGKRGYPFWEDNGHDPFRENPVWMEYLNFDERGVLVVSGDDAVRLALLHSREYQQNLEELYLSALDVSFERFRFDAQFFSANDFLFSTTSPLNTSAGNTNTTYSLTPLDVTVRKSFTAGGTFVAGLANSIVWSFNSAGADSRVTTTLFDWSLIQPLLRNAGRDRVMERLTVAERTLLANVRAMEQYRQGFYVETMTGRNAGAGPARRGGFFGGAGLEGFTGVGGGGFGRVGAGGGGGGFGGGAGAAQLGGYMGLLQSMQEIRNQEDNVDRLRGNLYRLEQTLDELRTRSGEAQLVSNILRQDLQVAQARQALFSSESQLLQSRNAFEATLDQFKLDLGLPPELCMEIRDSFLDQFELIDQSSINLQIELEQLVADFGAVRLRIAEHITTKQVPDENDPTATKAVRVIEWYPELEQDLRELKDRLTPVREVRRKLVDEHLPRMARDLDRLEQSIPRRREYLAQLRDRLTETADEACPLLPVPDINDELFRSQRLTDLLQELRARLDELRNSIDVGYERNLTQREERIDKLLEEGKTYTPERLFTELLDRILYPKSAPGEPQDPDVLVVLPADLLTLQLIQARARTESVELAPVDLRAEEAMEIARRYRLDWMNARAQLVDTWRLIEFNADQLEATLDVFFSGDVTDVRRVQDVVPFNLGQRTGTLRAGVQFDAPITRLGERNTYRQALLEYQQARRNYYAFEDGISQTLRARVRQIYYNQLFFELQRLAVLEAARQIDRNEDIRIESELSGQATGATAARDAVSALSDLLAAQNAFMGIWANFEADRRSLDFALGTLQLDQDGLWIDPGVINAEYGQIDPWVRVENNFVLPGMVPPEPLPQVPAAPIPQGALPGSGTPQYTAGAVIQEARVQDVNLLAAPRSANSTPFAAATEGEAEPLHPQPLTPAVPVESTGFAELPVGDKK